MTDEYGSYQLCKICGEWGWSKTHRCPSKWEAQMADSKEEIDGDEWYIVRARGAKEAAEKFADKWCFEECERWPGERVVVRPIGAETLDWYRVEARITYEFSAWAEE